MKCSLNRQPMNLLPQLPSKKQSAAVLLEVVLALVLFVAAAAIITAGINSSLDAAERQKLQIHAANLATTVLSELQLGIRPMEAGSPIDMQPPFTNWTCELAFESPEQDMVTGSGGLSVVEVIIRHKESDLVYRQAQMLEPSTAISTNTMESFPE